MCSTVRPETHNRLLQSPSYLQLVYSVTSCPSCPSSLHLQLFSDESYFQFKLIFILTYSRVGCAVVDLGLFVLIYLYSCCFAFIQFWYLADTGCRECILLCFPLLRSNFINLNNLSFFITLTGCLSIFLSFSVNSLIILHILSFSISLLSTLIFIIFALYWVWLLIFLSFKLYNKLFI